MIQIDMPMPTNCYGCWIRLNMECRIANDSGWLNDRRDESCPLEELKKDEESAVEMEQYCERYEPTYNPEDGSM